MMENAVSVLNGDMASFNANLKKLNPDSVKVMNKNK